MTADKMLDRRASDMCEPARWAGNNTRWAWLRARVEYAIMPCLWLAEIGGVGGPLSTVRRTRLADTCVVYILGWYGGPEQTVFKTPNRPLHPPLASTSTSGF